MSGDGDRPAGASPDRDGEGESEASEAARAVRQAVAEVRREWLKAAVLTALVDAVLVGLLVNLAATLAGAPTVRLPRVGAVAGGTVAAAAAAVVWGAGEVAWQRRRPAVERFEAANPAVEEALRTARDAVERGDDGPVARRLYADVVDGLAETSSLGLVPWRRVGAALVVVAATGVATVGVAAVGIDVDTGPRQPPADPTTPDRSVVAGGGGSGDASGELHSGDAVLGEETDVSAGDRNLSARVGAGPGSGGERPERSLDRSGYAGDGGVAPRRAGYADPQSVPEADLIREYTLALQRAGDGEEEEDPP